MSLNPFGWNQRQITDFSDSLLVFSVADRSF